MLNKKDILDLKRFLQTVIYNPRPIDKQPLYCVSGDKRWCEDWEIIEICKYLFNGREAYYGDPPPNRLKNNPLWSKDDIADKAEKLLEEHKTAEEIIEALKQRRSQPYE